MCRVVKSTAITSHISFTGKNYCHNLSIAFIQWVRFNYTALIMISIQMLIDYWPTENIACIIISQFAPIRYTMHGMCTISLIRYRRCLRPQVLSTHYSGNTTSLLSPRRTSHNITITTTQPRRNQWRIEWHSQGQKLCFPVVVLYIIQWAYKMYTITLLCYSYHYFHRKPQCSTEDIQCCCVFSFVHSN